MNECSETPGLLPILEQRYSGDAATNHGYDTHRRAAHDFLHAFGSPQASLLSAVLFVPEFTEVEGVIFLKNLGAQAHSSQEFVDSLRKAKELSSQAFKEYVYSFNWIELPYMFSDTSGTDEEYDGLAALVAEAWRARLHYLYPERRFEVRLLSPAETGGVVGVGIEEEL